MVHFIAKSPGVELSGSHEGMYQLTCKPPCPRVEQFRKGEMQAYRVSDYVFEKGYAEEGEYELVPEKAMREADDHEVRRKP
jgi:hypothetical protein